MGSTGNSGGLEQVLTNNTSKRLARKYSDVFIIIVTFGHEQVFSQQTKQNSWAKLELVSILIKK